MWNNNNASGGSDPRGRNDKDRTYEVLHYKSGADPGSSGASNGNRGSDGNKNRYPDLPRYRVVEQVHIFNILHLKIFK
jgi:hypothetical protein